MSERTFRRIGAWCAAGVTLFTIAYAVALLLGGPAADGGIVGRAQSAFHARGLNEMANYALALMGLLMTVAVMAIHGEVADDGRSLALWASVMGVIGAAFTTVHGYWEAVRTPILLGQWEGGNEARQQAIAAFSYVPNPIDPRGIGSFLFVGLFVLAVSWLIMVGGRMSRVTAQWGMLYGVLLVLLFLVASFGPREAQVWLGAFAVGLVAPVWWALVTKDLLGPEPS
ncbi:MAG: hypothetical protein ACK2UL_09435 [Anaerolineae bacterium]